MSRKRKRIAAVTAMMVAVLGLGLAGYIQATRASGRDNIAGNFNGNRSHGYRLNHQVGLGDAREWYVASNPYANAFAGNASKQADEQAAGSNEPENGDEALETEAHASDFVGGSGGGMPASAPPAVGDAGQGSSTLRLARAFGSGFAGGSGGGAGGSNGGGGNGAPSGNGPGAENPPPSDEPTTTPPKDETVNPPPTVYVPPVEQPNTTPVSVPEPATLGLFGLGIAAVGFMRRRRNPA